MKLRKSVYELRLKLETVAICFRKPNARWKGSFNRVESILQRWCLGHHQI